MSLTEHDRHLNNLIELESDDRHFMDALEFFIDFLERLEVDYIVIGSTALQSYLNYCRRIPGDVDVLLSEEDIERVKGAASAEPLLRIEPHDVASKLFYRDKIHLHLIPKRMKIVDKVEKTVFTRVNLFFPDRTDKRCLRMAGIEDTQQLRVPILEDLVCMNLNAAIDSNRFSAYVALLEAHSMEANLIREFVDSVPTIGRVASVRIESLRQLLLRHRPDLAHRLPVI